MEYSPLRTRDRVQGQPREDFKMSMIAMAQPVAHSAFKREFAWDDSRHSDYASSMRPSDTERIALPSIRQAIPELLTTRNLPQEPSSRTHSSATSPVGGFGSASITTTPDYIHSPNQSKRGRLSIGEEMEERISQVPRIYTSPHREREYQMPGSRGMSPTFAHRSVTESWTSLFVTHSASFPSMRDSAPIETSERIAPRPTLPRLPTMDPGTVTIPRIRGRSSDGGYGESLRHSMGHPTIDPIGPPHYRSGALYGYHHPNRVQSLSLGSVQVYDRTPFSPAGYGSSYPDYIRVGELGGMGMNGDNKQRKRRGNLPKETTDKLRAWFVAHLNHPYPTEDEKQKLMQRTGLQMSKSNDLVFELLDQISNWFINARRRQLPNMINNARAEANAMTARSADGKVLSSTERGDYDMDGKRDSPLSDGEGSAFDDDIESLKHRHAANMGRGSV
ncbi:homeobox KN domain-containing protein [Lasiosphaeris hirsuta]|uniref:Homeobox KN domain-containing protein n=1 Tax=Lasiosphaeris hirsuta TaxID=260670 RepID=A0AA40A7T7_9PEZI|nr:homeobox KN domain-containing protein [Lasiosphaeris hirsuta]